MNNLYDDLAKDCGEVVNNNEIDFIDKEVGENKVNELIEKGKQVSFAYSSPFDMEPGKPIGDKIDTKTSTTREEGIEFLVEKTAMLKALKEKAEKEKEKKNQVSKEEYEKRKKEFIDSMMYMQGEAFFTKNHHLMDGKTKKRLRRSIERKYNKGKFKSSGVDLND